MSSLTAAVVGTGFIGPVHVEGLRRAGVHVRGIVGSSAEKSAAAAGSLGLEVGYASFQDVLDDDLVDVVHLATPNTLHYRQAVAALGAGKHVLCEKPLAMNSEQSGELVQLAKRSGRVAGVAYNIRFYPLNHEAAARVAGGSIGDVLHVTGSYVQDWLLHRSDYNWRVSAQEGGELRAVADIGTHWLDLIQFITAQRITAVCASLHTVHEVRDRPVGGAQTFSGTSSGEGGDQDGDQDGDHRLLTEPVAVDTEDAGGILFRLSGGGVGTLWVSQTTAGRKNMLRYELGGSKAALSWDSESPNSLWIGHRDRPNERLIRDPSMMDPSATAITNYPGGHNEGFPDTFKQLFASFYGYIERGDFTKPSPFPTFDDGHREILLCEAILGSHRSRSWVTID